MKTINCYALATTMLFAFAILFTSCKKNGEFINPGKDQDLKVCNIKKIVSPQSDWKEATFSYDKWGNPEKIIMKNPNTGSPNFWFKYDSKQRLAMIFHNYSPLLPDGEGGSFEKFIYNKDGSVTDTIFLTATYKEGAPPIVDPFSQVYARHIKFDAQGRVSEIAEKPYWDENIRTNYFRYDAKGNLIREREPGETQYQNYTYHDNLSVLRTNKVWMFINADYSVNNKYIATNDNCYGLPGGLDGGIGIFGAMQNTVDSCTIEYMCDCGVSK